MEDDCGGGFDGKPITLEATEVQSKTMSMVEAISQQVIGFVTSLLLWQYLVAPWFGIVPDWHQNFQITCVFAFVSTVRGYLVRRFFNSFKGFGR